MRFYSIWGGARYVIQPAYRETQGVHSRVIPGLTVEFHDHTFESETVKDPETRTTIEDYLQGHRDFGVGIQLVKADEPALVNLDQMTTCIFGKVTPQGFALCGDPVEEGPYCGPHAAQVRAMAESDPELLAGDDDQVQPEKRQCEALTKGGARCRKDATEGNLCAIHAKALAEAVA